MTDLDDAMARHPAGGVWVEPSVASQIWVELCEARATIAELEDAGIVLTVEIERLKVIVEKIIRDTRVPFAVLRDVLAKP